MTDIQKMREELMDEWPWESMRRRISSMSDYEIRRTYTTIREAERRVRIRPQPFYEQLKFDI